MYTNLIQNALIIEKIKIIHDQTDILQKNEYHWPENIF